MKSNEYVLNTIIILQGVAVLLNNYSLTCSEPKGSVLGPLLRNLAFDTVFLAAAAVDVTILYYQIILSLHSSGKKKKTVTVRAEVRAEAGAAIVIKIIVSLGLTVSLEKLS